MMSGTGSIPSAGERGALPAVMRGRRSGTPRCGARPAARVRRDRPGIGGSGGVSGAGGKAGAGPGGVARGHAAGQMPAARHQRGAGHHPAGLRLGVRPRRRHRADAPGSGHVRPKPLPGQADRAAREAFMRKCGRPVRDAPPDGATVLPDAARPGWRSRPAHGRVLRAGSPGRS